MRLRDGVRPPIPGHPGDLWMASYSPDGTRTASPGIDGFVRVWDEASGKLLLTYRGNRIPFLTAALPVTCVVNGPG